MNKKTLIKTWENKNFSKTLEPHFGRGVSLSKKEIINLKGTKKSSLWKVMIKQGGKSFPVILKILPSLNTFHNRVELEMYKNPPVEITPFIPCIYHIEPNVSDGQTWILMQYVYPVRTEWQMSPKIFEKIIPTLSLVHARTHEQVFTIDKQLISDFIPIHKSSKGFEQRKKALKKYTDKYLDKAINNPNVKEIITPMYERVKKGLSQGPFNFKELEDAGHCIIHGDPHMENICLRNKIGGADEGLLFIDWESSEYSSGWFDLGHLVGMLIEFRPDWQKEEESIIKKCVSLYTTEMEKNGIVFKSDPMLLYKMAYVQRILEKWLLYQLIISLRDNTNETPKILLPRFLEKLDRWGRELELF